MGEGKREREKKKERGNPLCPVKCITQTSCVVM